ncbi:GerAB/ArcD/ProY family transporter [Aquibacillus kalidii]|uniref:GerAB/ArcD/ProY family transporter n=1 Tax=Aquibacillus kalidii TaxID=2762597 RepID=UPI00164603B8|nr:endospore germination permease [Aquibacillus kalidii]
MNNSNHRISAQQLTVLIIIYVVGDAILIMPSIIAAEAKHDVWIAALFSLVVGLLIVMFYYRIHKVFPDLTLIEALQMVMGKFIGNFIALLYISYSFLYASVALREVGDFITTEMLPDTPIGAVHILFALIIVMGTRLGLETIARSVEIYFPYVFLLLVFTMLALIPQVNLDNLKPVLEDGVKPVARASLTFVTYPFVELILFMMFLPYVNQKDKIKKSLFVGTFIGGAILVVFTIVTVLVLGYEQTSRYMYPGYILAKKINIGEFLYRIEVILAGIWFITIFFRITIYLYFTSHGLAQVLKLKDYRPLVYPLGLIMIVLSIIISPSITYINQMSSIWPYYDLTMGILIPLILLFVALIRRKFSK